MDPEDAEIVYNSQSSSVACETEISEYEMYCEKICDKEHTNCSSGCDVPLIIAQLKKRKWYLIKKGV
jgi:hypothetical protein